MKRTKGEIPNIIKKTVKYIEEKGALHHAAASPCCLIRP
jgi:hypothetical protein